MSLSARARTLTNKELIDLYELSSDTERGELSNEMYVRLFRYVYGSEHAPQPQLL